MEHCSIVNWFRTPSLFQWKQVYTITLSMFTYVVPLAIISWTYVQIGSRLTQSTGFNKGVERKCSTTNYGHINKRKKKTGNSRLNGEQKSEEDSHADSGHLRSFNVAYQYIWLSRSVLAGRVLSQTFLDLVQCTGYFHDCKFSG